MAWYRIFRSQSEAQKVHPDLGLPTCRANVCALYSLTVHPFAVSIFLWGFNCQTDWCNFQSSHHSGCIITDNAFSLGAPSRRAKSLSSFSSMIVTKQKCWARAQIFPWSPMVPCNHLLTCSSFYVCHHVLMHNWLSVGHHHGNQDSPCGSSRMQLIQRNCPAYPLISACPPCQQASVGLH